MLYAIWQPLPRPRHFPEAGSADRELRSEERPLQAADVPAERARSTEGAIRPQGAPGLAEGKGVRRFDLPNGWTLRLTYGEPPNGCREAGDVKMGRSVRYRRGDLADFIAASRCMETGWRSRRRAA
jgi:hypothetical protein